ncbi:MAG: choice-of-anchor Q domain-containing protein [Anaerolineales bacterium]
MKTNQYPLFSLIAVLAALAVLTSACNLTDSFANPCALPTLIVTRTEDTDGGVCTGVDCSLRQAVLASNSCPGVQTIQIPAGNYILTHTGADEDAAASGDLDITDSVIIRGEGNPVIDGDASDRIFDVKAGKTVSISWLTLQNGKTPLFGSAIANLGALTIDHVVIQNNHQTDKNGNGGAIFTYDLGSSLDISDSAVVNNWAAVDAAGLYNVTGTMTITNVTVSGNHGYGVANAQGGQTIIKFSTIADDFGLYEIWNPGVGNAVQVGSSIIAGRAEQGNCFQPVTSDGFNLDSAVGGTANTCGLKRPGDLIHTDPLLLPLAENGGNTLTLALGPDSPAINSADSTTCIGADQRGIARPQGAKCDIGAFELENPPVRPTLTPTPAPTRPPDNTPTPKKTVSVGVTLTFSTNSNCRKGPGTGYFLVTPFKQGVTVVIKGKNIQETWVLVQVPASGKSCWVAVSLGALNGSLSTILVSPTPPIPDVPTTFRDFSQCGATQRVVTLTWTLTPNATGYNIYRNGKLLATTEALRNSYQDTTSPNSGFFYAIEAFNDNGVSARLTTQVQACP